ncbi:MAG: hypothetical protein FI687_06245 [SAR202 cluster bacterium]|nr:hypothetical protein [SAR202 cluster bacterium]|tara:strand:+ start:1008 stop:3281 length:2274 start_codon:yes stop_codon:yes gene_type:complete
MTLNLILQIAKKDLKGYFDQPTGYILLVIFCASLSFSFFGSIQTTQEASLRAMFTILPWILAIFISAASMRLISEELRDGTLEILLTQPIKSWVVIVGKFFAAFAFVTIAILLTATIPISLQFFGDLDEGAIFAQYLGTLFLTSSFISIGLFASSLTRNQIVSFIISLVVISALMVSGLPFVTYAMPTNVALLFQTLSPLIHFAGISRGIIELRDILYFTALILTFLSASYLVIKSKIVSHKSRSYQILQISVGFFVFLIILVGWFGNSIRGKIDLTENQLYTLSPASVKLLSELDDIVTIHYFSSKEPSAQNAIVSRDVNDFLDGVVAASNGNVKIIKRYPDVNDDERVIANNFFVPPVQFSDRSEGELKVKIGWLGFALTYSNNLEYIPLIQSIDGLEYQLMSKIFKLTKKERTKVSFLFRTENPDPAVAPFRNFRLALTEIYSIREVPENQAGIPDFSDVQMLVVPAHGQFVSNEMRFALDEYFANGGKALFLIDSVNIETSSLSGLPNYFSLSEYLTKYGVTVEDNIVFDQKANEILPFPTQQGTVSLPYPYWPRINAVEKKISGGITTAVIPWGSSISINQIDSNNIQVEHIELMKTTENGAVDSMYVDLSPNSDRLKTVSDIEKSETLMAVAVSGKRCPPGQNDCDIDAQNQFRMIVIGDSQLIDDGIIQNYPQHLALGINWLDWLGQKDSLVSIRSKGASLRKLLYESKSEEQLTRYSNIIGVPAIIIIIGLIRLIYRRISTQRTYKRDD